MIISIQNFVHLIEHHLFILFEQKPFSFDKIIFNCFPIHARHFLFLVISSHTNLLVKFLEGDLPSDAQLQNLNALKMNCYLLCQFSERFEQAITGATTITVAGKVRISR